MIVEQQEGWNGEMSFDLRPVDRFTTRDRPRNIRNLVRISLKTSRSETQKFRCSSDSP